MTQIVFTNPLLFLCSRHLFKGWESLSLAENRAWHLLREVIWAFPLLNAESINRLYLSFASSILAVTSTKRLFKYDSIGTDFACSIAWFYWWQCYWLRRLLMDLVCCFGLIVARLRAADKRQACWVQCLLLLAWIHVWLHVWQYTTGLRYRHGLDCLVNGLELDQRLLQIAAFAVVIRTLFNLSRQKLFQVISALWQTIDRRDFL